MRFERPTIKRVHVTLVDPSVKGKGRSTSFTIYDATMEQIVGAIKALSRRGKREPATAA